MKNLIVVSEVRQNPKWDELYVKLGDITSSTVFTFRIICGNLKKDDTTKIIIWFNKPDGSEFSIRPFRYDFNFMKEVNPSMLNHMVQVVCEGIAIDYLKGNLSSNPEDWMTAEEVNSYDFPYDPWGHKYIEKSMDDLPDTILKNTKYWEKEKVTPVQAFFKKATNKAKEIVCDPVNIISALLLVPFLVAIVSELVHFLTGAIIAETIATIAFSVMGGIIAITLLIVCILIFYGISEMRY